MRSFEIPWKFYSHLIRQFQYFTKLELAFTCVSAKETLPTWLFIILYSDCQRWRLAFLKTIVFHQWSP